tara:strand:- start:4258 stop:4773 length:516 start_codon:yes stop_codon:yes gene_type:complete
MKITQRVTGKCSNCSKRTEGKKNDEFLCRKCKQLLDTCARVEHLNSLSPFEFGWLTGMIEGEGCFYQKTSSSKLKSGNYCYPLPGFVLMSTDQDVMEKFANLLQAGLRGPYYTRSKRERKQVWSVQMTGYKSVIIMKQFYEYLSDRRKSQIDNALRWQSLGKFKTTCRIAG